VNLRWLVVAGLLAGCGSEGLVRGTTEPGGSVLTADVTQVTYSSLSGGFGAGAPPGAACAPGVWSYVISFAAETRVSMTCTVNGSYDDPASFVPTMEEITFDDAQWKTVRSALAAVTVSAANGCGADLEERQLVVESTTGSVTYGDDFYACLHGYSYYVTTASLDNLSRVLTAIP
jgi:hypothetical protein